MESQKGRQVDVWQRLAKEVGVSLIEDRDRRLLTHWRFVDGYETAEAAEQSAILDDMADVWRRMHEWEHEADEGEHWERDQPIRPKLDQTQPEVTDASYSELGEYETWRSEAVSCFLAAHAEASPGVKRWREMKKGQMEEELYYDELGYCILDLTHEYPWTFEQAGEFLARGEPPFVSPIDREIRGKSHAACDHCRITISVDPRVSAGVVQSIFLEAKQRLLGKRGKRGNRGPKLSSLKMYCFVQQVKREGIWSGWADLAQQWNKRLPEDSRESPEECARTFRRVRDFLAVRYDWEDLKRDAPEPAALQITVAGDDLLDDENTEGGTE